MDTASNAAAITPKIVNKPPGISPFVHKPKDGVSWINVPNATLANATIMIKTKRTTCIPLGPSQKYRGRYKEPITVFINTTATTSFAPNETPPEDIALTAACSAIPHATPNIVKGIKLAYLDNTTCERVTGKLAVNRGVPFCISNVHDVINIKIEGSVTYKSKLPGCPQVMSSINGSSSNKYRYVKIKSFRIR